VLSCLFSPNIGAKPASTDKDNPKDPPATELRDKACSDGVYVRQKEGTSSAKPDLPSGDGGDFSPVSGSSPGSDMFLFQPEGDCSGFDDLFKGGPGGAPPKADSLEIAPAKVDGKPLSPDEAAAHFTSLAALSRLDHKSANVLNRFFDGNNTAGDLQLLDKLGGGGFESGAGGDPSHEAVKVVPGSGKREQIKLSQPARVQIEGNVPDMGASGPIRPAQGEWTVPSGAIPTQPGPVRQYYNNLKAETLDYLHGSPIANAEGERTILPNPAPIILPPGGNQNVNVVLPQGATGIDRHCGIGCYGTEKMIKVLLGMGQQYDQYYASKRKIAVGGISKLGGGYFPPHVSHQLGIDADVLFIGGGSFDVRANAMIVASVVRQLPEFHHINGRMYILVDQSKHAAVGWGLDQLVAEGNLTAEQAARGKASLVHWPNHNDHFHIRILP
jgi:hypothetical protein